MSDGDRPDLSLIMVTFNSADDVAAALESARAAAAEAGLSMEVMVVDNASTDSTLATLAREAPGATVIRNAENVGFGRANNRAFERARARRWLLLNPDARLEPAALGVLTSAADELGAAAVAPSIGRSGAESCGMAPGIRSAIGHFLYLNRLLPADRGGAWRGFQLRRVARRAPRPVDWASAAALLVEAATMRAVGGFDPGFFLYGEDVDLCGRITASGGTIWLVPEARAEHAIAGSQGGVSTGWVDALHDLYGLRAGPVRLRIFDALIAVGLLLRAVAAQVTGRPDVHQRRMRAGAARAWRLATGQIPRPG